MIFDRPLRVSELFVSHFDSARKCWVMNHAKFDYSDEHRSRKKLFSKAYDWLLKPKKKVGRPRTNRQWIRMGVSHNAVAYLKILSDTLQTDRSTVINLLILRAHADLQQSIQEQQKCGKKVRLSPGTRISP